MKWFFTIPIAIFFCVHTSLAQDSQLEWLLFELPDVIFERLETQSAYSENFVLRIKQPIDHSNPEKGHFYQKVFLRHRGFDRPTVLVTEGYRADRPRNYELSELLSSNQVRVEHRYFGESVPSNMDYTYLNLEQATADYHKIRELFAKIYSEKWVSTGISKGGSTTIFYRYFYPEDVSVSVPYVAPLNREYEDKRLYTFLDTIGEDNCRKKIRDLQVRLLKNRAKILPLLEYYSMGAKAKYQYLNLEQAFEYSILEYPFSFWQYGSSCDEIPTKSSSLDEAIKYYLSISDPTFFSDNLIAYYGSHYYQAATEMGYYGYETAHLKGLIKALPTNKNPYAAFLPGKINAGFNQNLLDKTNKWIQENGDQFIYINGALDTWSATAVPYTQGRDALWFNLEGKHHGSARIANMTTKEKTLLKAKLEEWLEMELD